jgi:hypothetical protein
MYRHEHIEGSICAFWRQRMEDGITIARYHRTEQRTPFDIHWTMNGDYFQHCNPNYLEAIAEFRKLTRKEQKLPDFIV